MEMKLNWFQTAGVKSVLPASPEIQGKMAQLRGRP
jgi:hypothetical protein